MDRIVFVIFMMFMVFAFILSVYYLVYQLEKTALEKGFCQKVVEHKIIWTKCQKRRI